jgi:CRP/FNR family transcriptional regulator, cyclic AMP receptor protein
MLELVSEFASGIAQNLAHSLSSVRGVVQLTATVLGLGLLAVAAIVRTMVPLRTIAVASNVCLFVAAMLAISPVHMLAYLLLIPLNTWRLLEIKRLTRKVQKASDEGDLSGIWLKPYMKPRRLPAGAILFRKGDSADSLYLLLEGDLELVEIGKKQAVGDLFGEISFFSPDRRRTLTARCASECLILCIGEAAFKQLYFQNPKFAFQISALIAHRLSADIERLRKQVEGFQSDAHARALAAVPAPVAAADAPAQPLGVA